MDIHNKLVAINIQINNFQIKTRFRVQGFLLRNIIIRTDSENPGLRFAESHGTTALGKAHDDDDCMVQK